jgi:hypothetical protein
VSVELYLTDADAIRAVWLRMRDRCGELHSGPRDETGMLADLGRYVTALEVMRLLYDAHGKALEAGL